jgi:hypothetical protein
MGGFYEVTLREMHWLDDLSRGIVSVMTVQLRLLALFQYSQVLISIQNTGTY